MFFRSTRAGRVTALITITAVTGVAMAAGTAIGADDSAEPNGANSSREVIARTGDLRDRITATSPDPAPARRLVSADVRHDLRKGTIGGTIRLGAAATQATGADLIIGFGFQDGNVCQGAADLILDTVPGGSPEATYSGATITANAVVRGAIQAAWDCAYAGLVPKGGSNETYDGLVGTVSPVYAPLVPKLRVKMTRSLKVKAGKWAKVKLTASNPGTAATPRVKVRLKAKRSKVKPKMLKLGRIGAGKKKTTAFRVRLAGRKKGTVTVRASAGKLRAGARLVVKRNVVIRRKAPVAGTYSGSSVDFRITRNRYLVGFRVTLPITCGGFPDMPTTSWGHYSFRRVKIPASGKIDAKEKGDLYTAYLEATVSGKRVTNGKFSYYGPARCTGHQSWTAKRKK